MVYFLPFSRSELNQLVERELLFWKTKVGKLSAHVQLCSALFYRLLRGMEWN